MHGPTGQPLGTLCVIDTRPRRLSGAEKTRLIAFADLVEQEINLHQRFRSLESELQHAAFHDPVTDLPERGLLEAYLARSLDRARGRAQAVAAIHIQLTNLETLIALEGQAGGDIVMQTLAKRLQQHIRPADQVGRLGTDRFLVILPSVGDSQTVTERVRHLVSQLGAPVDIGPTRRSIQLAAGVSRYPDDATSARDLLDCAHTALRHASNDRRATVFNFYSRDAHRRLSRRYDQSQRLAAALKTGALQQVYQPIVACRGGQIVAVEALARWHDAVYGDVSPGVFIPLIETNADLRHALTRWSLTTACRQLVAWDGEHADALSVTVNIPAGELYRDYFADLIRATLKQHAIAPHRLVLELTEQSLIEDVPAAVATISALRAIGVRFAVDDFGTGYSSLNYLKQLPLDTVKIDRSFIRDIGADATTRELTRGILDIAHTLALSVVAEGVETPAQHTQLQSLGCPYAQGFLFSRPLSADAVTQRLRDRPRGHRIADLAASASPFESSSPAQRESR